MRYRYLKITRVAAVRSKTVREAAITRLQSRNITEYDVNYGVDIFSSPPGLLGLLLSKLLTHRRLDLVATHET